MKTYVWLPLACLVGYLVGTWGAQDELRANRDRAKESHARSARKAGGFDTFANIVKIPETARRNRRTKAAVVPKPYSPISVTNAAVPKATSQPAEPGNATASAARISPEDLKVRIEDAQELWRTRVDIACTQWKAKLKLEGESAKAFDAVLQEMNERLYDSVSALAGMLEGMDKITPELGLRLVGETTTILSETYDKIGACASPDMREIVSSMQMVDFIDPGVAEPLVGVQGKLEGFARGGREVGR